MATGSTFRTDRRAERSAHRWSRVSLWLVISALLTVALWAMRGSLDKAHLALAYLLLVLGASAHGGRTAGIVLSFACFLAFNFFLLPPYYTLDIANPIDLWVLVTFLIAGGIAAQLLHREQESRASAEDRAAEIDRLAALGAECLAVPRAVHAIDAIARVVQSELPVTTAEILFPPARAGTDASTAGVRPAGNDLEQFAMAENRIVGIRSDGPSHIHDASASLANALVEMTDFQSILVPLRVRDRAVGVLRLANPNGVRLRPDQARFLEALSYYAALSAQRTLLEQEASHVAALRDADRLKDALLASVSHDLRTPLTSIRALAHELRIAGDEKGAVIEEEADRLNRMVSDLLDLSQVRAGKLRMTPEITAAEDLIGAALQRLSGLPGAGKVHVTLPADGTLPLGRFDFVHALRALCNLLENALRHSPSNTPVEMRVVQSNEQLEIRVLDRGAGVPEADRMHLFEPFFRSGTPERGRGTGLGLAIAREVAEAQGGGVTYEPREGGGSIFTLRLPTAQLEAP